jgi:hypothetical protein
MHLRTLTCNHQLTSNLVFIFDHHSKTNQAKTEPEIRSTKLPKQCAQSNFPKGASMPTNHQRMSTQHANHFTQPHSIPFHSFTNIFKLNCARVPPKYWSTCITQTANLQLHDSCPRCKATAQLPVPSTEQQYITQKGYRTQ